jgi:hypothetical protein
MTQTLWKAGNDMIRDSRYSVPAAMSLIVAGVTFFVAATITASAWNNPAYNYEADFISDLGVPGPPTLFGGTPHPLPLALLMNTAFVVNGALVVLAALLLLRPGRGPAAALAASVRDRLRPRAVHHPPAPRIACLDVALPRLRQDAVRRQRQRRYFPDRTGPAAGLADPARPNVHGARHNRFCLSSSLRRYWQ